LYLNGQRFEVAALTLELPREVGRGRRRRRIPPLHDVRMIGKVFAPPNTRNLIQLFTSDSPTQVRYRGLSGPFYIDAAIGDAVTFTAVAAGPVKWKP
jgi:hypothetical protein